MIHILEADSQASADKQINNIDWDLFLEESDCGHFQQSSHWAKVKASEGWHIYRQYDQHSGKISEGFQLLWKSKFLSNIGYISKGPVCKYKDDIILDNLIQSAIQIAMEKKLMALIVQLPDCCIEMCSLLPKHGFTRVWGNIIINATFIVNLKNSIKKLQSNMRRTTRQAIRQAVRRGVTVREGTKDDIKHFFHLMKQTCMRQKTKPNPSSVETISILWDTLFKRNNIRLTLAEKEGKFIAGLLCILFGNRFTLWKKGSNPDFLNTHAMSLLYWEAFEWAKYMRFEIADFFAMNREIASNLLSGNQITGNELRIRDNFNIGFGGKPELLPPAYIWFHNPIFRFANNLYGLTRKQ